MRDPQNVSQALFKYLRVAASGEAQEAFGILILFILLGSFFFFFQRLR